MCGLAGVAGDLTHKDLDVIKDLTVCSQIRGVDATGIATYTTRSKQAELYKQAQPAAMFLENRRADRLLSTQNDVIMVHTRKSTYTTRSSSADAHPFWHNDLIGAHNGSIPHSALSNLKDRLGHGAIDSEELIYNISRNGLPETLGKVWGAYALSLIDTENQKLGLIRNTERPLAYAFSKDLKRVYWASEQPLLYAILWRHGIDTHKDFPTVLSPHTLLEFDLASGKSIGESWTESKIEGGREPEKKSSAVGKTENGKQTTKVTTGTSGTEGVFQKLKRKVEEASQDFMEFDYSNIKNWSKQTQKRFQTIVVNHISAVRALEGYIAYQAERKAKERAAAAEEDKLYADPKAAFAAQFKRMYADKGCAFCCSNDASSIEVENCRVSVEGDILCDTCAQDETLCSIAKVTPAPKKVQPTCD